MKKYINFINENQFLEFLKKAFKNTITLLQQKQQEKITSLVTKIDTAQSFKDSVRISTEFMRSNMNPDVKELKEIKIFLKDDLISTDILLKSVSKKYGSEILLPKNFFIEESNNLLKKVFMYDNEKDFIKNLEVSVNSIFEQLMKNSGLSEDEINNISSEKVNEADEIQHLQNTDKLDDIKNNTQEEVSQTDDTEKVQSNEEDQKKEKNEQLNRVKQSYNDFQRNSLYEPLIKKLEEINKERENQDPTNF